MRSARPIGLIVGALVAVGVVVGLVVGLSGSGGGHDVYVTVPEATGVLSGQKVRSAGAPVGSVSSIEPVHGGHAARLKLHIDDDAWPLTKGTTMDLRWSGTIDEYNRYIELKRGPAGSSMVSDGGSFPARAFHVPVEYGQLLKIFTPQVRAHLAAMLDNGGAALHAAKPSLGRAVHVAPPALDQADRVLRDVNANDRALTTLVRSTGQVVNAVDSARPDLGSLVQGAGTTMDALASRAQSLQATLREAPGTFRHTRSTLAHASHTLTAVQALAHHLSPGVAQLRAIEHPLDHLLGTVVDVGPDARKTLSVAARFGPDVTHLLHRVTKLSPQIGSIGHQANVALNCIRPYTPDVEALGSDWGSAVSGSDAAGKYIRAQVIAGLPILTNAQSETYGQLAKADPGLKHAFPRPPGYVAGQPWFLPECGVTKAALDPAKDPESQLPANVPEQILNGVGHTK